jgi:polyhydroxybutyrate depolymerase
MSNGGVLAHRLACELSDRIAAIAPVAGVLGVPDCAPARPVSVLQFHGTLDTLVPFAGNASFPAVAPTLAAWAARNGCDEHGVEILRQGDSRCTSWPGCDDGAEVVLCVVDGGGHTWPGGQPLPALGHTTSAISATDLAWSFFERHPMGAR